MAPCRKKVVVTPQKQQQTLQGFARVSKAGAKSSVDKAVVQKTVALAAKPPDSGRSRKRRRDDDDDLDEEGAIEDSTIIISSSKSLPVKKVSYIYQWAGLCVY